MEGPRLKKGTRSPPYEKNALTDEKKACLTERMELIFEREEEYNKAMEKRHPQEKIKWEATERVLAVLDSIDGLKWFLTCGTALACLRNGHFIPYDQDVDIGVFFESIPADVDIRREMKNAGLAIEYELGTPERGYELSVRHGGQKVDVVFYYRHPTKKNDGTYWWASYTGRNLETMVTWTVENFEIVQRPFYDRETVRCADENFMLQHYGVVWRTPKAFGYNEGLHRGHYKSRDHALEKYFKK